MAVTSNTSLSRKFFDVNEDQLNFLRALYAAVIVGNTLRTLTVETHKRTTLDTNDSFKISMSMLLEDHPSDLVIFSMDYRKLEDTLIFECTIKHFGNRPVDISFVHTIFNYIEPIFSKIVIGPEGVIDYVGLEPIEIADVV